MAGQSQHPVRRHAARVTVWHDGACPLCRREMAAMRRLDRAGAIRFVDVNAADGLSPAERAWRLGRFHAEEDGQLLAGAAAFVWGLIRFG